jgi:hypothetical protein
VHNVLTCDADGHMFCYKLLWKSVL